MIYDKATHEARKYWRERLGSMSFAGLVALDHPRPKDGPPRRSSVERALAPEVHALLRRLTSGNAFLSYTACALALRICGSRYSGEPEATLFSPATSGGGANVLPIGGAVDGGASFKDALLATRELLTGAYRFQLYPWSRMVLDLPDERRPRQLPLVASMAGLHGDLPDEPFDIAIHFDHAEGGTRATLQFDARLYEAVTLERFFQTFSDVLRRGLDGMTGLISELHPGESAPAPDGVAGEAVPLHRLIEARAAEHPDRPAVVQGGRATTYGTLERQAAELARTLADLSLDVRRPVALLMNAGVEQVASMLAVLKLGGAFASIDPMQAVDAECVLAQPDSLANLDLRRVRHAIAVRSAGDGPLSLEIARRAEGGEGGETSLPPPSAPPGPSELARVFQWLNARHGIGAGDRCLLSPGLGACQRLYDTLGVLAAGGSVELPDAEDVRDTSRLAKRLMAPEITVWDLPTPLAQNLLAKLLAAPPELRGPRAILLSGEKQCARLVARLARRFPGARITGLYAPAELGLWTTFFPPGDGPEAIAQAIPGFDHRVLNRSGVPAPPHTTGELRLASSCTEVGTGLRAAPLGGGRLRWLRGPEHCSEKHGCRVELTSVEAALCEHDGILAAEVIAIEPEPGAPGAVAAFIVVGPDQVSAEAARDWLVQRGGLDLIPDRFFVMEELPLAADGAIDRESLARRLATHGAHQDGHQRAAAEEVHARLKQLWLEILELEDVGEDDSFFASGGNSLKATLLLARIKDDFSVDLSVQQFFREPSTRAVAQLIAAEARRSDRAPRAPDLKIVPRDRYRIQLPE